MAPEGLSERGSAFWSALNEGRTWDPAGEMLVAEACRIVDRLEKLDLLLRREIGEWATIVDDFSSGQREIHLEIDDALAEARQQQGSLLQVLMKLGLGKSEIKATARSKSDELREKRAQRIAGQKAS